MCPRGGGSHRIRINRIARLPRSPQCANCRVPYTRNSTFMHLSIPRNAANVIRTMICMLLGLAWLQSGGPVLAEDPDALTTSILGEWIRNGGDASGGLMTLNVDGTFTQGGKAAGTWKWVSKETKRFEV